MSATRVAAIIAAGGHGVRAGAGAPKQLVDLGGTTMLDMSVGAFRACDRVQEVVVALPAALLADPPACLRPAAGTPVALVPGGSRRQDSVAAAFEAVRGRADLVVVHDAARPFVPDALIRRTIAAAEIHGAAIAALPVRDTVKRAEPGEGATRVIAATIPRCDVFLAQTPQAFRTDVLARAIAASDGSEATDEAMLVERAGLPVHLVEGDPGNIKVTTAEEMEAAARAVRDAAAAREAGSRAEAMMRVGTGYDLHRLVPGRPLVLGGVTIPFEMGLDGHSDADVVCHAVTDAVLGAAAAGDIGRLFPDTDPAWKGADSVALLRRAVGVVHRAGYRVVNVDVTVIAERPKLAPHLDRMVATLAAALDVSVSQVSVKGKTNEGVDAVGRRDAMACHAVALVARA